MARTFRDLADAHVAAHAELDPLLATSLGLPTGQDRLPDLSPAGDEALAALEQETLRALDAAGTPDDEDGDERRCARLLRERLTSAQGTRALGEHLRNVQILFGPVQDLRTVLTLMPTDTPAQRADLTARLAAVPEAFAGYTATLREGIARGLLAAPRQVDAVVDQLGPWAGWFGDFAAEAGLPDGSADAAAAAVVELRDFLAREYRPHTDGVRDGVGEERYRAAVRRWNGADADPREAYDWAWTEFHRVYAEQTVLAEQILPGATPREAMTHLETHGEVVEGVAAVRERLQGIMDSTIAALQGTHVDLAPPLLRVEAMIAPEGSAAAPYYTQPSLDFARPGRTWLPTLGRDRFPMWDLVSTWYHEGVPGHHLQLAQWALCSDRLSSFQASAGMVSANIEGWALYAERLMDELGFLVDPGERMGYLDAQMMRIVRVIIDIGMHLELEYEGAPWTPERAREFFGAHCGRDAAFLDSELLRYLGGPGQAISYKLGERAWLAGRAAASRKPGFDLKAWHMAALSQGSLGLDDLEAELAAL
ncbi:DUF885 domain-containing protein [Pseudonocardia oroxyli]|uniref:Uncharacterized conserved protein, DUF885 familyt n=1 Tax=Pseudonocardia oroxyli TaxID=366584 RepID=A0A1G7DEJ0_PSEOR|nr:DUF885 domain-containing protein [Pseudonocardia oroxyli]SDE49933.1 Uncharacterized conserved protein, DUF885 familyt [Pseudonocardia oroxyli]